MRNLLVLAAALQKVEDGLTEPLSVGELADAVYCSASGLQKLFRYAFHCSVAEYIAKRRLTCASRALLSGGGSITDIAFDFRYASPEVFTRAFKRFWGVPPSEFRKTRRFSELFPKFENPTLYGGAFMAERKPVDVSELYDLLKEMTDTYILCIDLKNFDSVNKTYGRARGDIVIAEAHRRIECALTQEMLLFRTGGDEFAVVTGYRDLAYAQALAQCIAEKNDAPVQADGTMIPLAMWIGITKIPDGAFSYKNALEMISAAVNSARCSNSGIAEAAE